MTSARGTVACVMSTPHLSAYQASQAAHNTASADLTFLTCPSRSSTVQVTMMGIVGRDTSPTARDPITNSMVSTPSRPY